MALDAAGRSAGRGMRPIAECLEGITTDYSVSPADVSTPEGLLQLQDDVLQSSPPSITRTVLVRYIGPAALKRWVRLVAIACFLALASVSAYGASQLSTDSNLVEQYSYDSFLITYSRILGKHFYSARSKFKLALIGELNYHVPVV